MHVEYLRLQTHVQNMQYLLLFHENNGYANKPQCNVIHTLPVFYSVCTVRITYKCHSGPHNTIRDRAGCTALVWSYGNPRDLHQP